MFIREVRYTFVMHAGYNYRLFPNGDWQRQRPSGRGWEVLKGDDALHIQLDYEEELESRALEEDDANNRH